MQGGSDLIGCITVWQISGTAKYMNVNNKTQTCPLDLHCYVAEDFG